MDPLEQFKESILETLYNETEGRVTGKIKSRNFHTERPI